MKLRKVFDRVIVVIMLFFVGLLIGRLCEGAQITAYNGARLTDQTVIGSKYYPNVNMPMRTKLDLKKAVVHHTASHDVGAKVIDKWHKERGWWGVGYHFVIRKDGRIENGRPLTMLGAHARSRNNWVGIALTGRDTFTNAQVESLRALLEDMGIERVERHHQECPGDGLELEGLI